MFTKLWINMRNDVVQIFHICFCFLYKVHLYTCKYTSSVTDDLFILNVEYFLHVISNYFPYYSQIISIKYLFQLLIKLSIPSVNRPFAFIFIKYLFILLEILSSCFIILLLQNVIIFILCCQISDLNTQVNDLRGKL